MRAGYQERIVVWVQSEGLPESYKLFFLISPPSSSPSQEGVCVGISPGQRSTQVNEQKPWRVSEGRAGPCHHGAAWAVLARNLSEGQTGSQHSRGQSPRSCDALF